MKTLYLTIILASMAASVAGAKTVDLPNEKFSLDLPDSWNVNQQPTDVTYSEKSALIIAAQDTAKPSGIEILVCNNVTGKLATSPDVVAHLKDTLASMYASRGGDAKFYPASQVTLDGAPAELLQYTVNMDPAHTVQARTYVLAANGRIYLISLRTLDPIADAGLQTIANSLHFSSPPELPTPPVPRHRFRYIIMAGVAVVAAVAGIAGLVLYRPRQA